MSLAGRVVGQNQAIDFVAEALLKSILAHDLLHRPTTSLLFLGLTSVGQAGLVRSLAENFVSDDGIDGWTYLLTLNCLSTETRTHFSYSYKVPLELSISHSQYGFPLLELVRMRPHSILVFSQVEQACISVFSALLSVLDQARFLHNLSDMLIHTVPSIEVMQQNKRGFRSELLNRIDEIVFFNPFALEQLRKVARLSLKAGLHLEDGSPLALSSAIYILFTATSDPLFERVPEDMDYTSHFSRRVSSTVEATLSEVVGISVAANHSVTN
ncbi:hypothetical protein Vadar_029523 [Vaccinium darrowii]|uniref:Uncharacterized protein n=1 Tax=Vaccinium darrowii TaxID=229202 RepID=A0ACB7XL41_9ERIC|nr:hypothetical protein Vadar_029523 [Vaccinium darrowii]